MPRCRISVDKIIRMMIALNCLKGEIRTVLALVVGCCIVLYGVGVHAVAQNC